MSCYGQSNHLLKLCFTCSNLQCDAKNKNISTNNSQKQQIIAEIQKNYANLLEIQLKKLDQRKQQQIEQLYETIRKLKTQILRLESRNKIDKDNQNRLKQQIRNLQKSIKHLQQLANKPTRVEVKQVFVEKKQNLPVVHNNCIDQKQLDELKNELLKLKSQAYSLQIANKDLLDKLQRQKIQNSKSISNLNYKIQQLESQLQNKNKQIYNLNEQKQFLTQKIDILNKPVKIQYDPIVVHKITTQAPEIRTVYIEKPVQKTKIIEVQKVIRQFIEPSQPIVNRIIQCPPSNNCRCQDSPKNQRANYQEQIRESNTQLNSQYKEVINQYKGQRQKLLKAIYNRDSDYRILQKKLELIEKFGQKSKGNKCSHVSFVDVKVFKHEQKVPSQNSEKGQKINTKKGGIIKNELENKNTKKR